MCKPAGVHACSWLLLSILLAGCGGGGGGGTPAPQPPPAPPPAKPNILLIVADDLGVNDLGAWNGNPEAVTPSLDALAREGVRFTRHYAESTCSPMRAALLSGQHPVRNGYVPNSRGLSPQLVTLPDALKAQGYTTWHIGKWHIGDTARAGWPDAQGFDHWFGFLNQWLLPGEPGNPATVGGPRYIDPWLVEDGSGRYYPGHLEDILTDKALQVVQAQAGGDQPWFINLWFYAPHSPVTPSAEFAARHPDTSAGRYRALVEQLDHNIGRVLEALERSGQADNTIVLFASDNGGTNASVNSNYPYHGYKTTYLEGGVRTPLLLRLPDGRGAGITTDGQVTSYDLYPTLLALAGLPAPIGLDGRDVSTLLEGATLASRDLFWETPQQYAVRSADQRWLLTRGSIYFPGGPVSLYDLAADPAGATNVSASYPEQVAHMEQWYRDWHRAVHRPALQQELDAMGRGQLGGLDFVRTPGYGGFSFGIGVEPGYEGRLAAQDAVWSLALERGTVTADFGGVRLQGPLTTSGNCHSVVVSARFNRAVPGVQGQIDTYTINLYLDTVLATSAMGTGKMQDQGFATPTIIGEPDAAAAAGRLTKPLLLNVAGEDSPAWTIPEMAREICGAEA